MVSLEQIRALEARVEKAVVLIDKLRKENAELEQRLIEASRSEEQIKTAYSELERSTAASTRVASEAAARIEELSTRFAEAEEKAKNAGIRLAEAEEKAGVFERKAIAAEAETETYRERALASERRVAELESRAEDLKREQSRIEEGLSRALVKLDAFEDLVMGISVGKAEARDEKVEATDVSPSVLEPQADTFPGAENELDIF